MTTPDLNHNPLLTSTAAERARARLAATTPTATRFEPTRRSSALPAWVDPQLLRPAQASASAPKHPGSSSSVDWDVVARLRALGSTRLSERTQEQPDLDEADQRQLGRAIIQELLESEAAEELAAGQPTWTPEEQSALAEAIYASMFGAGRLQPLLDRDDVENILVAGYDNVWLELSDGSRVSADPVAESDEDLNAFIDFLAQRTGTGGRSFSPTSPSLHLRMEDGSRLAATAWVHPYTSLAIRRHRLKEVSLEDLVNFGTITPIMANFLRAAVLAGKSIVISGPQKGGKTVLLRALIDCIPPDEVIGTFETEYELHTHQQPDKHPVVFPWEEHPGSGDVGPDGTPAGSFTLGQALRDSFRFALDRYVVGEIRGPEVWVLVKALESGGGSLSTTHAARAKLALDKLVSCCLEMPNVNSELAMRKLSQTIDLVVQIGMKTTRSVERGDNGSTVVRYNRTRYVEEIIAIEPSGDAEFAHTEVFKRIPGGGVARPNTTPAMMDELAEYGFDLQAFEAAVKAFEGDE